MNVVQFRSSEACPLEERSEPIAWSEGRMFAIAFDLNTKLLAIYYPGNSPTNAYAEIGRELKHFGFQWQQGSLYYGDKATKASHCTMAVLSLSQKLPWFAKSLRDIRMLRIEESDDLMHVIGQLKLPLSDVS